MKKNALCLIVVFVIALAAGVGSADQKNTGCGLGSMLFEGKNGLMSQTFAVTTNGTLGNQTFGITSGTSNCDQPKTYARNDDLNRFVAENMDSIAKDMAKGHGEYLSTLAVLMDIPEGKRSALYSRLQTHFSRIFTSENVSYVEVIKNIESVLSIS